MTYQPGLSRIASLLADPAREAMLVALADRDALPAGELAQAAGLSPQSASGHLRKLVAGGVLRVKTQGRFRYYSIANADIASIIEGLSAAADTRDEVRGRRRARRLPPPEMCAARSCYDHLAGRLGVALAQGLAQQGIIATTGDALTVTDRGRRWLAKAFEIELDALKPGRRGLLFHCLDWTERRYHLAGPLPAKLFTRLSDLGWISRSGTSRAVRLTPSGQRGLAALGIEIEKASVKTAPSTRSR